MLVFASSLLGACAKGFETVLKRFAIAEIALKVIELLLIYYTVNRKEHNKMFLSYLPQNLPILTKIGMCCCE